MGLYARGHHQHTCLVRCAGRDMARKRNREKMEINMSVDHPNRDNSIPIPVIGFKLYDCQL